jgi:hypothetical protein
MPRYRVVHRQTGETWEVESSFAEGARQVVGWPIEICDIYLLSEGPYAEIVPPQIAKQVAPPRPGKSHICPDCKVSMIEAMEQGEFWWQCPSCDLFYQEWENRFYRSDEI